MFSVNKISLILFYLLCIWETNSYRIGSKCGFPGLPHETKIEPVKNVYEDGEEVTYRCPDDKIYSKTQVKKCVAGVWTGHRSTCGYFMRNQLMRVKIVDNNSGEVVFEGETSNYTAPNFPASFFNGRGTAVTIKEAHKPHKWYFNFSNPMSFDFFLLNVRIPKSIPLTSSTISQIDAIRVKSVHIINEPHRNCTIDFSTLDKSAKIFWFWCTVNESITSDEPVSISFITSAAQPVAILGLYQVYFTKLQYCGQPQVPLLAQHVSQVQCDPKVAIDANDNQLSSQISSGDVDRFHSCVDDQYWAGNPKCLPKMFCQLNYNKLTEEISSVQNAYIFNETKWYAIEGTVVEYKCKTGFDLVTNSKRTCFQNSTWDRNDPICSDLESDGPKEKSVFGTSGMVIPLLSVGAIILILVIISITVIIMKYRNSKDIKLKSEQQSNGLKKNESFYDDVRDECVNEDYAEPDYSQNYEDADRYEYNFSVSPREQIKDNVGESQPYYTALSAKDVDYLKMQNITQNA